MNPRLLVPLLALTLGACDIPGMGPDPRIAQREAEGKAIGGACRYALRGIEECYQRYPKAPKTAIFDGWKEMDAYMRDNKLAGQAPGTQPTDSMASDKPVEGGDTAATGEGSGDKVADKGGEGAGGKNADKAEKAAPKGSSKGGDRTADRDGKNGGKAKADADGKSAPGKG